MKISAIFSTITVSSRALRMQAKYLRYLDANRNTECNMCHLADPNGTHAAEEQILWRGQYFYITKNLFPYAVWDGSPVLDHLMLVPNRHVDSLSSLFADELSEWVSVASEYEGNNYSIYSRSPKNGAKSVVHQHAHLISVGERPKHFRRLKHGIRVVFAKR